MEIIKKKPNNGLHPWVPELQDQLRNGQISRREFCAMRRRWASRWAARLPWRPVAPATPQPRPPRAPPGCAQPRPRGPPTAVATLPSPPKAAAGPLRGGTMTIASHVQRIDHPARLSWIRRRQSVAAGLRVSDLHRPRQHHRPLAARQVECRRPPQDLDAQPQEGHQVQRRRGADGRRRRVQSPTMAGPGGGLLDASA